jgi:predicted PurR-regulated permease PerM
VGSWFGFWHGIPIQRRKRIALLTAATLTVLLTLWEARTVLGLYVIGLILAYVLEPAVNTMQRGIEWLGNKTRLRFLRRGARSVSIIISYLLLIAAVAGFISLVVPIVLREAEQLWAAREVIGRQISAWFEEVLQQYELLPDRVRLQIDEAVRDLSSFVTRAFQQAIQGTFTAISYTTSIVLGITIVPFWTFFLLRDLDLIRDSINRMLPSVIRDDLSSILRMLDHTIGGYLRGQIGLMIIIGVMQTIALTLLGLEYALLLGVLAGILEIVPNIGPTIAAIPAVLVALTQSPGLALATAVVCILIQAAENSLIVPRVLGRSVGLHPVVMMVMLVIGTEIAGLPGLVLAPILTAVLADVYRYLVYRFADTPSQPADALAQVLSDEPFSMEI